MDQTQNIKVGKDIKQINLECEEGTVININHLSENAYCVVAGTPMLHRIEPETHCGYVMHGDEHNKYIYVPFEDFEEYEKIKNCEIELGSLLGFNKQIKKWQLACLNDCMTKEYFGVLAAYYISGVNAQHAKVIVKAGSFDGNLWGLFYV